MEAKPLQLLLVTAEEWQRTFDAAPDLIAVLDGAYRIVRINTVMADRLGCKVEDAVGRLCYECVHGASGPIATCPHAQLLQDGQAHTADICEPRLHGDFLITCSPLHDAAGKLVGSVHVARDVTEHKRAEAALRAREAELRALFRILPTGVAVVNADLRVLDMNPALARILSTSREALLDGTFRQRVVLGGDGPPLPIEEFPSSRAMAERREVRDEELAVVTEDGTTIWVNVSAAPLPGVGAVVVTTDVTERKKNEEQIRAFSRKLLSVREEEKQRLSAALHHDVGSLAVGMAARLDAVEDHLRTGKAPEALAALQESRTLFDGSVAQLKRLASELRPPDLDILGLAAALRQYFVQITRDTRLRIRFTEQGRGDPLPADDSTVLFRIVQEAVTNVVKHARATQVHVRLAHLRKGVRLSVRDNGKGFDPQRYAAHPGTRLGLRTMREMVLTRDGTLELQSRPGQPTRLTVTLPRRAKEHEHQRHHRR